MGSEHREPKPRPPIIRLMSTATYTRPGVPPAERNPLYSATTYRTTLSDPAAHADDMTARCAASRVEASLRDMVRAAAASIPLDRIDALAAEAAAASEAALAAKVTAAHAASTAALAASQPLTTPSLATFSATLAAQPRMPAQHVLTKTFFTAGNPDGPFPGSQSEQGAVLAGSYWVDAARLGNTKMVMGKPPSKFADGGYKLKNDFA
jgi:hypothetical protein